MFNLDSIFVLLNMFTTHYTTEFHVFFEEQLFNIMWWSGPPLDFLMFDT